MSFPVWVELVCDGCSNTTSGQFTSGTVPRRSMKAQAKDDRGWVFENGGKMLCKKCARLTTEDGE